MYPVCKYLLRSNSKITRETSVSFVVVSVFLTLNSYVNIHLARTQYLPKNQHFLPHFLHTCAYQRLRDSRFSEYFAYALNE